MAPIKMTLRRAAMLAIVLALAGCASTRPAPPARLGLKLPPAALGEAISVQQHLTVERNGRTDELDAALEVDADRVELVGLAFGQRVLTLSYDGKALTSWRHVMLPSQVKPEDVLEDVQLALWPAEAIAAALPPGWEVRDNGLLRSVTLDGVPIATVSYSVMPRWSGTIVLDNLRYQYRLTIQSAP